MTAHVAGLPVEELLVLSCGALGTALVVAGGRLRAAVRRGSDRAGP